MKWRLAWLLCAAVGAVSEVAGAQESIDAHALAATGDATADRALGRTRGAFAWEGDLVLRAQRTPTLLLGGIELLWPLSAERGPLLSIVAVGVVGYAPHIVGGATVHRSYDPRLPASFAGSAIDLAPGALPEVPTLELALGAGVHTSTTFQDGWSYEGGALDWLSFDDGARALPDGVPDLGATGSAANSALLDAADDFSGTWEAEGSTAPPDLTFAARAGDRYELGAASTLAVHASALLRNAYRTREESFGGARRNDQGAVLSTPGGELERSSHEAQLAAALRVRLEYGDGHALESHTWLASAAEDRVSVSEGASELDGLPSLRATELRWREQRLFTQQLRGEQALGAAGAPQIDWHYALTLATDDEPDRRQHASTPGAPVVLLGPATRRFIDRDLLAHDLGADLHVPLIGAERSALDLEAGLLAQWQSAEHEDRLYNWQRTGDASAASIDELLAPENAGVTWEPSARVPSAYDSTSRVLAGYAALDAAFGALSFRGGVRLEHAALEVTPIAESFEQSVDFDDLHVAPSAHIGVRPAPVLALHAAWSLTVDRPRANELAPVFHAADGFFVIGEPQLDASRQHNVELGARFIAEPARPLGADGAGVTVVHHYASKPIRSALVGNGDRSFDNGDHRQLWWLEAQADKHFGFIAPWLSDAYATLGAALPLSSSEVLRESAFSMIEIPALDVPDYVVTARIAYDQARRGGKEGVMVAVAHQSVGERATVFNPIGGDETLSAMHLLDVHAEVPLAFGLSIGVSAHNLLDAGLERRVDDVVVSSYRLGRAFLLGLSFREPDQRSH